jgi:Cu-Zn family superoxide dismutase
MTRSAALLLAAVLGACSAATSGGGRTPTARALTATLRDAQGAAVGTATLTQEQGFVRLVVEAQGLTPGQHGIHIHARGVCTPPDFTSAGGHFNPGGRQHGMGNPAGQHAGDFPNMQAGADGRARYDAVSVHLTVVGPGAVLPDSAAVVIHAQADDQVTDPTGNSGGRVACGVLTVAAGRRTAP